MCRTAALRPDAMKGRGLRPREDPSVARDTRASQTRPSTRGGGPCGTTVRRNRPAPPQRHDLPDVKGGRRPRPACASRASPSSSPRPWQKPDQIPRWSSSPPMAGTGPPICSKTSAPTSTSPIRSGRNWGTRRVINDERDAQDLAAMLRIGRLTEAWIAPPEVREPRELVRYRYSSVRHRTSAKAQIHGVMAKNGILRVVGELWGPIGTIDHRLRDGRGYRALVRLPWVGKVIVSIFVAEIGDVRPTRTTQLEELPDRPKKPYLDRHGPLCTAYGGHLHTTAACSPPAEWRPASQSRHRYGTASLLGLSAVTARVISAVSASHVRVPFGWRSRCCFWDMFKSTGVLVDTDRRARRVREPAPRRIWRMNRGESPTGTTPIRRLDGLMLCRGRTLPPVAGLRGFRLLNSRCGDGPSPP